MAVIDRYPEVRYDRPTGVEPARSRDAEPAVRYVWAVARLSLGWVFLWAFLDKLLGLETADKQAWINGGHPTEGFLKGAAAGPFKGFYNDIAGAAWADWLFMLGLAGIGTALVLGIGVRAAAAAGAVLLVMMWTAVLPPENNPFMDDHLVYALLVIGLAMVNAGDTLGLGRRWGRTALVRRYPVLKSPAPLRRGRARGRGPALPLSASPMRSLRRGGAVAVCFRDPLPPTPHRRAQRSS
ncbi:DoxX family membrane protein [Actinomadura sp. HBU206391]|uniref:DoxX family membrane protein n=1 Tax=Actinomadura sp. HBU206391 TaxID=2731692 RepID=UPI00164FCFC5|nr:DoxX family membrane protein [Actinomadura sp. HBU206391]